MLDIMCMPEVEQLKGDREHNIEIYHGVVLSIRLKLKDLLCMQF